MASAVAGLIGLQVGTIVVMIAISMAFVICAHAYPGGGRGTKGGAPHSTLPYGRISTSESVDAKVISSPPLSYKSPDAEEFTNDVREARTFRRARRSLDADGYSFRPGSTPPSCDGKCEGCTPCDLQPIVMPHMDSVSSVDYKYEHWACVCMKVAYMSSARMCQMCHP